MQMSHTPVEWTSDDGSSGFPTGVHAGGLLSDSDGGNGNKSPRDSINERTPASAKCDVDTDHQTTGSSSSRRKSGGGHPRASAKRQRKSTFALRKVRPYVPLPLYCVSGMLLPLANMFATYTPVLRAGVGRERAALKRNGDAGSATPGSQGTNWSAIPTHSGRADVQQRRAARRDSSTADLYGNSAVRRVWIRGTHSSTSSLTFDSISRYGSHCLHTF